MANMLRHQNWPLILSAFICFFLGLACLVLTTAPSEGIWYFFANYLLSGAKLYTELQMSQQPVFIIINAIGLFIFGKTYFEQKIIFILILILYIYFGCKLVQKISISRARQAILLLSFFMCSIHFEAYRFDDYHALLGVLALAITYRLANVDNPPGDLIKEVCITGVLVGVAILTRVNDGLSLFLAVLLILYVRNIHTPYLGIASFTISVGATVGLLLLAIDESPINWLRATVLESIDLKGGASVFSAPFQLIRNSIFYIFYDAGKPIWILLLALITVSIFFHKILTYKNGYLKLAAILVVTCLLIGRSFYYKNLDLLITAAAGTFLLTCSWTLIRFVQSIWRKKAEPFKRECLLLIPLALYGSGAMSSGGQHYGLYFPLALTLLVAATLVPPNHWKTIGGTLLIIIAADIAIFGFSYRVDNPYSWHSYRAAPLTEPRTLVNTPGVGSVPMSAELRDFILPICKHTSNVEGSLLSIPFPYANYICGQAPWKGYIQTFFDTSSQKVIERLIHDLHDSPPRFILYQRQLKNLRAHEVIYNGGAPLPHRELDRLIITNVELGKWNVIYRSTYGKENSWTLIDTNR